MYQGQTPQTFRVNELMEIYNKLTCDEKTVLTDAAKIYVLKQKNVKIIKGEPRNLKITTKYDLELAEALLNIRENNKCN